MSEHLGYIPLAGEFVPRRTEDTEDRLSAIAKHIYFCEDSANVLRRFILRWEKMNGFKTLATIDPQRANFALSTLYQKCHHGRAWGLKHLPQDDPMLKHFKNVQIRRDPTRLRLVYCSNGYIVDNIEDAMEFGVMEVDCFQLFLDWMASDPPDSAQWPEKEIQLSETDRLLFVEAAERLNAIRPRRFIVHVTSNKVTAFSVKDEPNDDSATT